MPANKTKIITGQHIPDEKRLAATTLRREMTDTERLLWQAIRDGQILGMRFRRQQVINGFIVDFYCHNAGLVIEVDGAIHEQREAYDAERDRILAARGLKVLRIPNQTVIDNLPKVVQLITEQLQK